MGLLALLLGSLTVAAQKRAPAAHGRPNSPIYLDVTRQAGIDFHLTCGTAQKLYIMDAMCGGIGFIDFDNDGWPDIFLLNGSTLERLRSGSSPRSKLYRNNHDGTFSDVTEKMGITERGWGMGVAAGDFDNDGYEDLYLTYLDHAVLLHNDAGKRFSDVTARAGVGTKGEWTTSAAFADYDRDGFLDLYVAGYVDLDLDHLPAFGSTIFCRYRGIPVSCGPRGLKGGRDHLFHNNGDGTFTDVTEAQQIDPGKFYGLGVLWLDYDHDGCPDVYVSDDSSPSMLYRGDCKGNFTDVALEAGVAYSADGQEQAGMGVDSADYDHDGHPDIAKINFSDDVNNLYHNTGTGEFTDVNGPSGFGAISTTYLGFGVKFLDFDNDGWPDVFVANGHVNPQVEGQRFGVSYRERNFLFRNLGNGRFTEIGSKAGAWMRMARVGRGAAAADLDNDGRVDLLVSNLDASPVLARNVVKNNNHWVTLKLVGKKSNRDAIGAHVTLNAGGMRQTSEVRANSSYLSVSDLRLHFGLGKAEKIDSLSVEWPSGIKQDFSNLPVGKELRITEGEQQVVEPDYRQPGGEKGTYKKP